MSSFIVGAVGVKDNNGVDQTPRNPQTGDRVPFRIKAGTGVSLSTAVTPDGIGEVTLNATGASVQTSVADPAALKTLSPADGTVATVKLPGATWVYSATTGAGIQSDDQTVIRPNGVLLGSNGRWYNVDASPVLPTIAALRLAGSGRTTAVQVQGYYTGSDGAGGAFDWFSSVTTPENGGTIIQATGVSTGRWLRRGDTHHTKHFGAKGDGVTDDTTTVNACITWAIANKRSVHFPAGTYVLNYDFSGNFGPLLTVNDVRITGEGIGKTIILGTDQFTFLCNECSDLTIRDMDIQGVRVLFQQCKRVRVENCRIDLNPVGGLLFQSCVDFVVTKCVFTQKNPESTTIGTGNNNTRAIDIIDGCHYGIITHNSFYGVGTCVKIGESADQQGDLALTPSTHFNVSDNYLEGYQWTYPACKSPGVARLAGTFTMANATSITRTSGPSFPTLAVNSVVRLLQPVSSGTDGNLTLLVFSSATANFTGLSRQDIVEVAVAGKTIRGIIHEVVDSHTLNIEQWHLRDSPEPVDPPGFTSLSFTTYHIWLAPLQSNDANTINIYGSVSPPNISGFMDYEENTILDVFGSLAAFYATATYEIAPRNTHAIDSLFNADQVIVQRNHAMRWFDAISVKGQHSDISDNYVYYVADTGITALWRVASNESTTGGAYLLTSLNAINLQWNGGKTIVARNHVEKAGINGIFMDSNCGSIVNNTVIGYGWLNIFESQGIILSGGSYQTVSGNICDGRNKSRALRGIRALETQFASIYGNVFVNNAENQVLVNEISPGVLLGLPSIGNSIFQNRYLSPSGATDVTLPSTSTRTLPLVSSIGAPTITIGGTLNTETWCIARIEITTGGALGTAKYRYSVDGGAHWTTNQTTSGTPAALGGTGITVAFPSATYAVSNGTGRFDQTGHFWIYVSARGVLGNISS